MLSDALGEAGVAQADQSVSGDGQGGDGNAARQARPHQRRRSRGTATAAAAVQEIPHAAIATVKRMYPFPSRTASPGERTVPSTISPRAPEDTAEPLPGVHFSIAAINCDARSSPGFTFIARA